MSGTISGYAPIAAPREVVPGDAVRKRGCPLRIGLVAGVEGNHVLVRWNTREPATCHDYRELQRRL